MLADSLASYAGPVLKRNPELAGRPPSRLPQHPGRRHARPRSPGGSARQLARSLRRLPRVVLCGRSSSVKGLLQPAQGRARYLPEGTVMPYLTIAKIVGPILAVGLLIWGRCRPF